MTPERRRAIWAIYGKQTKPHMSLFLVCLALPPLLHRFLLSFSTW